jgi:hypothetical protein
MKNKNQHKEVVPILNRSDLHKYQEKGVEHILTTFKSALFLEMGL